MGFGGDFSTAMRAADSTLLEMFGADHEVGGKILLAVLDDDEYRERQARKPQSDYAEGVWASGTLLICRMDDLGFRPDRGTVLDVDGKEWLVGDVSQGEGLLEISLEANES